MLRFGARAVHTGRVPEAPPGRRTFWGILELPSCVVHKVANLAWRVLPLELVEGARHGGPSRGGVLVPSVAPLRSWGPRRAIRGEAVKGTMLETIACQEICGVRVAVLVCVLLANIQPRGENVLGPHVRVAIGARVVAVPVVDNVREAPPEGAVVPRGHEGDKVGGAGVNFDYLLLAAESKGRGGIQLTGGEVQHMNRQADDALGICVVADPLLVRDVEGIFDTDAGTPLVLHREVRGAQGLHEPIRPRGSPDDDVFPRQVHVAVVWHGTDWVLALADELPPQVVHFRDGLTGVLHHGVGTGRGAILHELSQHGAVKVDVVDVGAGHAHMVWLVDEEGEGLLAGERPVGLALVDKPHGVGIQEVGPVAVRHTGEHGARVLVYLANGGQHLQLAMREVDVAGLAIHHQGGIPEGIARLGDQSTAEAHRLDVGHVLAELRGEEGPGHAGQGGLHALTIANAGQGCAGPTWGRAELPRGLAATRLLLVESLHVPACCCGSCGSGQQRQGGELVQPCASHI
mmetsp:Transcript_32628/g.82505  ORF Transcript_32628/g.82505 Transcript_32628/m.82505 type:complete len:517 (+) Transcript_32628:946-2496(+)